MNLFLLFLFVSFLSGLIIESRTKQLWLMLSSALVLSLLYFFGPGFL